MPLPSPFLPSLRLRGFLSFAPDSEDVPLQALNVLIGPNGSGKSNFLDAFGLLQRLPNRADFEQYWRHGGGSSR